MLVNKSQPFEPLRQVLIRKVATGGVCVGLFALLSTVILGTPWSLSTEVAVGENATVLIGKHFFSDFLLPFELASVLLLMALVGAIILARREFFPDETSTDVVSEALTLPERPRELVPAGGETSNSDE
jgi:NAD(P)H-quinone oxidoreductase subunit 6